MDRSKSPAHVKNRLFLTLLASAERNIYRYWDNIRQHRSKKTTVLLTSRMSNKLITKKKNMKFKKPGNKYGSDSVEYFQKTDEMRSA